MSLSVCPSVCVSVHLSVSLSVCPSVGLSVYRLHHLTLQAPTGDQLLMIFEPVDILSYDWFCSTHTVSALLVRSWSVLMFVLLFSGSSGGVSVPELPATVPACTAPGETAIRHAQQH